MSSGAAVEEAVTSGAVRVRRLLREAAAVQARLADALADSGLTVDRWRVLAHVAESPDASMSDVADALVLPPASTTRAVDALVEIGTVYREVHPVDRRRVVLRVSAQGVALLARVAPAVEPLGDDLPAAGGAHPAR